MAAISRLAVFTDKYPLVGPVVWILSAQYFAVQIIVASTWANSGYSWTRNFISDLGNSACGVFAGRYICSPDHALMNISFISLGAAMAIGSLLIYQEFKESRWSLAGFSLMALAGLGTILVGVFPENTVTQVHLLGAFLAFGPGNLAIIIIALAIKRANKVLRFYTYLTGIVCLSAFVLYLLHVRLGLGQGGMERLVSYPQTLWLILFGLYMSGSHYRKKPTKTSD